MAAALSSTTAARNAAIRFFMGSSSDVLDKVGRAPPAFLTAILDRIALGISFFGRFEVSLGGERIESDAFRKRAADLLKLLALSPKHALHRDQIVDILWPDKPPSDGANNLYRAVHDLRSAIGDERLTFRQGVVELHDAVVDVDVFEAEAR